MSEKRNWIVYKHVSPSNKVYVGITQQLPEKRFGIYGHKYLRRNKEGKYAHPIFALAILKYGWDNFEHTVVYTHLTKKEACKKEEELIERYKKEKRSYNVTNGGEGTKGIHFKHSEETKRKISLHHASITQEIIEKIKRTMTGQNILKKDVWLVVKGMTVKKYPLSNTI